MGYAFMIGTCGQCGRAFTFNPLHVPSLHNRPFCQNCIEMANPIRIGRGLEPIKIHPQAYEACNEEELGP
jgi:hypothetical protein